MSHKVEAVILDWAGTVVDFGSWAPTSIFVEAFQKAYDFMVTLAEARAPMGLGKWDHIKALGHLPEVAERWQRQFGRVMGDKEVDHIYQTFMPLQKAKVADFADPIPGALEALDLLSQRDVKIGSCTGYPREVMEVLIPAAEAKGYKPDAVVASDDLRAGARPGPWMALQNVIELGVNRVAHCIKVDDSEPGITEGLNAGMWTVGVTLSGNEAGMTLAEYQAATSAVKEEKRRVAKDKLKAAGAHFVIDTVADLPAVVTQVEQQLANGDKP